MKPLFFILMFVMSISAVFAVESTSSSYIINDFNAADGQVNAAVGTKNLSHGVGQTEIGNLTTGAYTPQLGIYYVVENVTVAPVFETDLCNIYFNTTSPQTYPVVFSVWTDCTTSYSLYRNGTSISNDSVQTLAAGYWNFTVIRDNQVDYTNVTDTEFFTINRAGGLVHAYINNTRSGKTIFNGTPLQLNASLITGVFGQLNLSVDGVNVNTSSSINISNLYNFTTAGSYTITAAIEATENYTGDTESWIVTVLLDTGGGACDIACFNRLNDVYTCIQNGTWVNGSSCFGDEILIGEDINKPKGFKLKNKIIIGSD